MKDKVTINGKEYTMKHCVRARIIFETITDKMWSLATLTDQYNYLYSSILAADPGVSLNYAEFLDALDKDPTIMVTWQEYLTDRLNAESQVLPKKTKKKGKEGGKN